MLSVWEAASLLTAEILVAGVPPIASTCRVLEEIIEGTPTTLATPCGVQGSAEALVQKMADSKNREIRAYVGDTRVRFDVRRTASGIDELFLRLIARSLRIGQGK